MIRNIDIDLEFQNQISGPPVSPKQLHNQACSNDEVTVNHWRDIWISQTKENHKNFGPFAARSAGKFHNLFYQKPCIVAGAGPSLKNNVDQLKDRKGMALISCLHNYHFLEDRGIEPDFYVTLDAGPVTIEEVAEGGTKTPEEYWASTKNKKLLAFIGSHPELLKKWQGEIYFFNAPMPDKACVDALDAVERFNLWVSSGGNVLGACFYIAKAIMGANPVVFVGADFSFSYNNRFHPFDSKYDKNVGAVSYATDVYGIRVKTWQSYMNFKCWFEAKVCSVPGIYINATEGGIFGSYPDGNIQQIKQMTLSEVIRMYSLSEDMRAQCEATDNNERMILF
jgi:hypothetical protein